jgi:YfaZ precursor
MKTWWVIAITGCVLAGARPATAQTPLATPGERAVDATIGNDVLQVRYLGGGSPISGIGSSFDYGVLLTDKREFAASAALMFDTDIVPLSRLRLQLGPQGYLAWLATGSKTQVFALAVAAGVRYELIPSLGLAAFGSGAYSPGVLTFGSAHNLYDFTAGAEIRLVGRLFALAGYRWFKFTLVDEPDERLVNEVFAGVRWQLQ